MYAIVEFLKKHKEVVNLDFAYNDFGDEGVKILSENFLNKENNIRHINFISCSIGGEGMESLYLAINTLKLETLRLNGNDLGYEVLKAVSNLAT